LNTRERFSYLRRGVRVMRYVWCHPANRGRRFRAVAVAVSFQVKGRLLRLPTLTRIGASSWIWAELHCSASSKAAYANPPDWDEMQVWRRFLRANDLFIDVGVNVGTYTMWASDCGAEVIAVEPDPEAYRRLVRNASLARTRVTPLRLAMAASAGTVTMTSGRDTLNRLVREEESSLPTQQVEASTLDELISMRHVRGIKIDVEGAERPVLQGASRALHDHRIDLLQIEWNHMSEECLNESRVPVAALLARHGYELVAPDASGDLVPGPAPEFHGDIFSRPRPQRDAEASPISE
jgi:FkbM family methyltransferase